MSRRERRDDSVLRLGYIAATMTLRPHHPGLHHPTSHSGIGRDRLA